MLPGQYPAHSNPCSRLELSFECYKLKNADTFSKSDPCVVAYEKKGDQWVLLGRTETVMNNLNPKFSTCVNIDYFFEAEQVLRFDVLDIDDHQQRGSMQGDNLGSVTCTLAQIVQGRSYTGNLLGKGKLRVLSEECSGAKGNLTLQFRGSNLMAMDTHCLCFSGKSDPFLVISKLREDGSWVQVMKTEVVYQTLDPQWPAVTVSLNQLCQGDMQRPIMLSVRDYDSDDRWDEMGHVQTTVGELQNPLATFRLKGPATAPARDAGTLSFGAAPVMAVVPTFMDFLAGGLEISVSVAIDFTASNGDPQQPTSLHSYSHHITPYEHAIRSVGSVIAAYDRDQLFPAFGFGGVMPGTGVTSHCFTLNGAPDARVHGVEGMVSAYRQSLQNVRLSGPTLFHQIINTAAYEMRAAAQQNSATTYSVLLIVTDGAIMDMDKTIEAIVDASHLPLSIIIVGVGDADFASMVALDGDHQLLEAPGHGRALRDIVQFVEFNDFQGPMAGQLLSREVLAELPGQVEEYFHQKGIRPAPPIPPPPLGHIESFVHQQTTTTHVQAPGSQPAAPPGPYTAAPAYPPHDPLQPQIHPPAPPTI